MASFLSVTSNVTPAIAARIAYPMFVTPTPRRELRPDERRIMDEARETSVRVRSSRLSVYEWKKGADVVLLVHGWRSRASQFNVLVRSLRARGFSVVAFDAPANGASEGTTTDLADYIDTMRKIQRIYGEFAGVIGHSFGALAALSAVNEGFLARRVVGVGSIPDVSFVLSTFAKQMQLTDETMEALVERYQFTRGLGDLDIRDRFSGLKNPVKVPTMFVHDADDNEVPQSASVDLHAAHGANSKLMLTEHYGHAAVLSAGDVAEGIVSFLAEGAAVPDQKAWIEAVPIAGREAPVAKARSAAAQAS